jgi:hypothetical protein
VALLNFVFTTFDDVLEAFGSAVYKVETVHHPNNEHLPPL